MFRYFSFTYDDTCVIQVKCVFCDSVDSVSSECHYRKQNAFLHLTALLFHVIVYVNTLVAQWLEHCVSSTNVVGSIPREHKYWQYKCIAWMHCKSLWIKASAKCISVNVNMRYTVKSGSLIVTLKLFLLVYINLGLFSVIKQYFWQMQPIK